MSSERSIMDAILRRRAGVNLEEASFEAQGSRFTSSFGRYYKDGKPISRDDYFKYKQASQDSGTYTSTNYSAKAEPEEKKVEREKSREEDEDLIAQFQNGDSDAANKLISRYEGLIRYIAKSYFAPGADVNDIAQEGLLGVYDAMSTYVPEKNKNFKQYAMMAAKRNIVNFIDKQNTQKNAFINNADDYDGDTTVSMRTSHVGNPEEEYSNKESQARVDDFMKNNLTDTEQKVLNLYLQGYTTKEMMSELGVSNKGIENAMRRVRHKAREWQESSKNESVNHGNHLNIIEQKIREVDATPKAKYDRYLQKHRRMVLECYESIMKPTLLSEGYPESVLSKIQENIETHDDSKYGEKEWEAYQNYFYDSEKYPRNTEAFNEAWNHHQKANPHHWQYWCLVNDVDEPQIQPVDMPLVYIVEMLCDWHAAGKHYGNTAKEWYEKQGPRMLLSENTRFMVESYIDLFG